jgi:hypothetical protein
LEEKTMPSAIEDWYEILQLIYRERHLWDNVDPQGWANVFAEDGYFFDGSGLDIIGREALRSYAEDWSVRYCGRYHVLANPLIELDGDTAKTHAYFLTFEGFSAVVIGTFDDEVVRTSEGWRIAKRVATVFEPPGYSRAGHDLAAGLLDPRLGLQHRGQLALPTRDTE